jgi:hypothetical protein
VHAVFFEAAHRLSDTDGALSAPWTVPPGPFASSWVGVESLELSAAQDPLRVR